MLSKHFLSYIDSLEKNFLIIKAGKKDISKLVKKYIVDKNGRMTVVYVKPQEENIGKKIFSILMSIFGINSKKEISKKVYEDYVTHKEEIGNFSYKVWVYHLKEYLLHKDSWDEYFRKEEEKSQKKQQTTEKKPKKEKKEGKELEKISKEIEKKVTHDEKVKPLQLEILRKIYQLYNGKSQTKTITNEQAPEQKQQIETAEPATETKETPSFTSQSPFKKVNNYTYKLNNLTIEKADRNVVTENYVPAHIASKLHPHEIDAINHIVHNYINNNSGTIHIGDGVGLTMNMRSYAALYLTLKELEPDKHIPIVYMSEQDRIKNSSAFLKSLEEFTGEKFEKITPTSFMVHIEGNYEIPKNKILWISHEEMTGPDKSYENIRNILKDDQYKNIIGMPLFINDSNKKGSEIMKVGGNSYDGIGNYSNESFLSVAGCLEDANPSFLSLKGYNIFRNPANLYYIAKLLKLDAWKVLDYIGYRLNTVKINRFDNETNQWVNLIRNVFSNTTKPHFKNGIRDNVKKFVTLLVKEGKLNIHTVKNIPFKLKVHKVDLSEEIVNEIKDDIKKTNEIKYYDIKEFNKYKGINEDDLLLLRVDRISSRTFPDFDIDNDILKHIDEYDVHIVSPYPLATHTLSRGYSAIFDTANRGFNTVRGLYQELFNRKLPNHRVELVGDPNLGSTDYSSLSIKRKEGESKNKKIIFANPPSSADEFYKHVLNVLGDKIENIDDYNIEIEIISLNNTVDVQNMKYLTEFLKKHNPSAEIPDNVYSDEDVKKMVQFYKDKFDIHSGILEQHDAYTKMSDFIYEIDPNQELDIDLKKFEKDEKNYVDEPKVIKGLKDFREAFKKAKNNYDFEFSYDNIYPDFTLDFGKYRGKKISEIKEKDYDYYRFIMLAGGVDPLLFKINKGQMKKSLKYNVNYKVLNYYLINRDKYLKVKVLA